MALRFVLDEHLRGGWLWHAIQQHNAQGVTDTLIDFRAKMQARKPSFAEFEAGFQEL